MLDLARGTVPLADLLDPRAGVIYIDDFTGAAGGPSGPSPRLLCGDELVAYQPKILGWLSGLDTDGDRRESLHCHNRPAPPACGFGATMEYDPAVSFVFSLDPVRGLFLRAVTTVDVAGVVPADAEAADRRIDRAFKRLSAKTCPPPAE